MVLTRLSQHAVEKVWGRRDLPAPFSAGADTSEPIGEIHFEHPGGAHPALLVKYLFTSAKLSVQVHPGNAAARERGLPHGKDEAWYVLDAEPGAVIGIGLTRESDAGELRRAALDGSIEQLVDWRPVSKGDVYYAPAGTIHAIGAGLSVIEVQQNLDLTYRLYDYGRDRELQLDESLAVADPGPLPRDGGPRELGDGRTLLCAGRELCIEQWNGPGTWHVDEDRPLWLIPLQEGVAADGAELSPASVTMAEDPFDLSLRAGSTLLVGYPGERLLQPRRG